MRRLGEACYIANHPISRQPSESRSAELQVVQGIVSLSIVKQGRDVVDKEGFILHTL